jgi:hypothetical protein
MRPPAGRALLAALLSLAVASVALPPNAAAVVRAAPSAPRHGLGAIPPSMRVEASAFLASHGRLRMALPTSVDLSQNAPAIGDQGQVGSCAPWAIGYGILGYYSRTQPHAGAPFAALSLYNVVNGGVDGGSRSTDIFAALQSKGIVEQAAWTHGTADYRSQPNSTEAANALKHRTSGGSYLFSGQNQGTAAMAAVETALAAGKPVAIGIPIYMPFEYLTATDSVMTPAKATGSMLGGHMVAAYGYDSTGVKIANSWGTGWGRSGWGTLSWDFVDTYAFEASTPGAFTATSPAVAPSVSGIDPRKALTTGGGTLTVRGANLGNPVGVQLVGTQDPSAAYPTTVVTASSTVITATLPGNVPAGSYRVVVTNAAGSSADTTADDLVVVAPPAFSIAPVVVPAIGGTATMTGSGFGSSAAAFAASGWSATADGSSVRLTWVSDASLTVTLPGGIPGRRPSVVLSRLGYSSAPVTSVGYGSAITGATPVADAKGTLLRVTGKGLARSASWTLTSDADATKVTNLPVSTESGAVGVVVLSDTSATVRLPAAPGAVGSYHLAFTPDQATYPGAAFADTPAAHVGYRLPLITSSSTAKASTLGGTRIVLKGTGLLAVPASGQAVAVRLVADPTRSAAATVVERSDTSLTLTLPAAAVEGVYRIVVTTPLGTATASSNADLITYVKPFVGSVGTGTKAAATGGAVRLTGSGFGSTLADFGAARLKATVNGRTASVTWISDTTVSVTVPAGVPGATASIALLRDGVPGPSVDVPYVAVVTGLSATTGPTSGGTVVVVSGKGFAGSSAWKVTAMDGSTVATLSPVSSLDGASSGVLVLGDGRAVVKMPAVGAFGAVYLAVTPDQALYPGAGYAPTSRSVFVYSDLG